MYSVSLYTYILPGWGSVSYFGLDFFSYFGHDIKNLVMTPKVSASSSSSYIQNVPVRQGSQYWRHIKGKWVSLVWALCGWVGSSTADKVLFFITAKRTNLRGLCSSPAMNVCVCVFHPGNHHEDQHKTLLSFTVKNEEIWVIEAGNYLKEWCLRFLVSFSARKPAHLKLLFKGRIKYTWIWEKCSCKSKKICYFGIYTDSRCQSASLLEGKFSKKCLLCTEVYTSEKEKCISIKL